MLQGTEAVDTSEIFASVFDEMYGEGAIEAEAERMAGAEEGESEVRQPIGFGREPEEVSMKEPGQIGFQKSQKMNEIIQQEYYIYMIEEHQRLLKEAAGPTHSKRFATHSRIPPDAVEKQRKRAGALERARRNIAQKDSSFGPGAYSWMANRLNHPKTGERMPAKEWAELILSMGKPEVGPGYGSKYLPTVWKREPGMSYSEGEYVDNPEFEGRELETAEYDWQFAKAIEKAGFPASPAEFHGAPRPTQLGHPYVRLPRSMTQWNETSLNDLVSIWDKYIKGGGDIRSAVEKTQIDDKKITDALAALYKKLTADANIQQHAQ